MMRLGFIGLSFLLLCGCRTPPPPPAARRPEPPRQRQLFVVIDDAGLSLAETQQFLDLPIALTIAVLPQQKDTAKVVAAIAQQTGKEMILHQPMESYHRENPGPGAIHDATDPADVPAILDRNLTSVRGAKGINNHMGSRVTENAALMQAVMRHCRLRGLYFLDSKTGYNSMVQRVAVKEHIHFEERDVFLDIDHDPQIIQNAWRQSIRKADAKGYAIVIGHAWSEETATVLRETCRTLENNGYTFHRLSELYP